jgi:hypothetical protein
MVQDGAAADNNTSSIDGCAVFLRMQWRHFFSMLIHQTLGAKVRILFLRHCAFCPGLRGKDFAKKAQGLFNLRGFVFFGTTAAFSASHYFGSYEVAATPV